MLPPIDILREHPGLRLIVIAGDARVAKVYELRPHETAIADVSPSELLHVIRSATAGDERRFGEDHPPESIGAAGGCTPPHAPPIDLIGRYQTGAAAAIIDAAVQP